MGQTEGGVTAVIVTEPAGLRGLHPRPSNAGSGRGAAASRNWWQFAISDPPRGVATRRDALRRAISLRRLGCA